MINGSIGLDSRRTLDVQGGATWSAGTINLNSTFTSTVAAAGHIINRSGSIFNNTFDGSMFTQNFNGTENGADALFDNQAGATFRKSAGTATTRLVGIEITLSPKEISVSAKVDQSRLELS